jgi:hypothetical protein
MASENNIEISPFAVERQNKKADSYCVKCRSHQLKILKLKAVRAKAPGEHHSLYYWFIIALHSPVVKENLILPSTSAVNASIAKFKQPQRRI